jgi:acyl transferase domain-containing protein
MARELYEAEPHFRQTVDNCSELLKPHLGLDLRRVLYPHDEERDAAAKQLTQTFLAQPALFVIQYALARLWMEWGIQPQAMLGHSIGEYTAACLAGLFSLDDGLALVAARGRLMQSLPAGAMLAVPLAEDEARSLLNEHLSLAAVNGAAQCVISGETSAVHQLETELAASGAQASEHSLALQSDGRLDFLRGRNEPALLG